MKRLREFKGTTTRIEYDAELRSDYLLNRT